MMNKRTWTRSTLGIGLGIASMLCVASCGKTDDPTPKVIEEATLSVVSTTPVHNASSVALNAPITLTFSAPIAWAEGASGADVSINPPVLGATALHASALTWTPDTSLTAATRYKFTLPAGTLAHGDSGRVLDEPVTIAFDTAAGAVSLERETFQGERSGDEMRVRVLPGASDELRRYELSTTAELRDNEPASKERVVEEQAGAPRLRSGSAVFDALFAMSIEEVRENAVSSISDGAFNHGDGVPCECFETGAKWNYVWTRDTAYAVDLGLALIDPERAMNSLSFKLSPLKGAGPESEQIVQDTGSGGSWPVSTDRVVWAIGAEKLLPYLEPTARAQFASRVRAALKNTAEQDRAVIYDDKDGLYRGEQSFLDWREQSYPMWTAADTVHIAESKALSTNVGHMRMLALLARLSKEQNKAEDAARYGAWANALAQAIDERLWLEEEGLYSAMKLGELAPRALKKYDLLGQSLLALSVDGEHAARAVKNYPRLPTGPAVLWPQQPLIPIYHNRGIWPFVTAYDLLAARAVGSEAIFMLDLQSLVTGAALNLSNMENFEMTTLKPWVDDGAYSGPVVNSRRQLWSVAGYVGAIMHGIFGLDAREGGELDVAPFVPVDLHEEWFADASTVTLSDWAWRGKRVDVELILPELTPGASGVYTVESMALNGAPVSEAIRYADLDATKSLISVTLGAPPSGGSEPLDLVEEEGDYQRLFAPNTPALVALGRTSESQVRLGVEGVGEQGVVYDVWRNGVQVAGDVAAGEWVDQSAPANEGVTYCYTVHARFLSSGHESNPTQPQCVWQDNQISVYNAWQLASARGGAWSTAHGEPHYEGWGDAGHELELFAWQPARGGAHAMQLVYGNGSGGFNTGITASVKEVVLKDYWTDEELESAHVVMPQLGDWTRWGESSLVSFEVEQGRIYRVVVRDSINMSYFAHFEPYTGGVGGGSERFNRSHITQLKILAMEPRGEELVEPRVRFDGEGDLGKLAETQHLMPGAPVEEWSRWGIDWDEDAIYVSLVSRAFESEFRIASLYFQVPGADGALKATSASRGLEYSGQTPALPFDASFVATARRIQQGSSEEEPWSGLYMKSGEGEWRRVRGFAPGRDLWSAQDHHTLSWRIPREALGDPSRVRVAGHVVYNVAGEEWKELLPSTHTPWLDGGGEYVEIDLSLSNDADRAVERWGVGP